MNQIIELEDHVTIGWANDACTCSGVVKYIPVVTGDCWHILGNDGNLYYFQQFEFMVRKKANAAT